MPALESKRPLELVAPGGTKLKISNRGTGTAFYGETPSVSSTNKTGSVAQGESLTISGPSPIYLVAEKTPVILDLEETSIVEAKIAEASSSFYNLGNYGTTSNASAAFTAVLAAIAAGGEGGAQAVIGVPAGVWKLSEGIFTSKANLEIVGLGGASGYSEARGKGASVITVPNGVWGLTYNAPGGVQGPGQFQPPVLRNLHFLGSATAEGGARFSTSNGYLIENCTFSNFPAGVGFKAWGPGQYSAINNSKFVRCLVGIEVLEENGLCLLCNLIDGAEAATYKASTFGIKSERQVAKTQNDTLMCVNNRIQGVEKGIYLNNMAVAALFANRFEYFKVGIELINCYGTEITGGSMTNDGVASGPYEGANSGTGIKFNSECRSTIILDGPKQTTVAIEVADPGGDTFTSYTAALRKGSVAPEGSISGNPGDTYIREKAGEEEYYVKVKEVGGNKGWKKLV